MKQRNPKKSDLVAENLRFAKNVISQSLSRVLLDQLREITRNFSLSLRFGDLLLLSGGWYVTHTGLIRLAKRCRCSGIQVHPVRQLSDQASNRYTFRATVYKSARCRGFVGYGDADPNNVSSRVHGAELRVAETRAVNRALRKASALAFARSKRSGPLQNLPNRLATLRNFPHNLLMGTAAVVQSEIASAKSFANINSIQIWSRPMPLTSAPLRRFGRRHGTR